MAPDKASKTPSVRSDHFLKGPVPLPWLAVAATLPGKALAVGTLIWFLQGLRKNHTVKLTPSWLRQFGVERQAAYRALKALERARLITIARKRGESPTVTIVDVI
jgi:hypothetical protein